MPSADTPPQPTTTASQPNAEPVAQDRPEVLAPGSTTDAADGNGEQSDDETIDSPAKIIRVGSMVKQLLEEVRNTPLDEAARDHMVDIYGRSIAELQASLSPNLAEELDRLAPDFDSDEVPSEATLRIAQAQLVGWLEGLFHGIQATLVAQQMAARQQLEGVRGQLGTPGGPPGGQDGPMGTSMPTNAPGRGPTGYL